MKELHDIIAFGRKQLQCPPTDDEAYIALLCVHFTLLSILPTRQHDGLRSDMHEWIRRRKDLQKHTTPDATKDEAVYEECLPNFS
jgi:hypothetical protein